MNYDELVARLAAIVDDPNMYSGDKRLAAECLDAIEALHRERDELKRLSELHGWRQDYTVDDDVEDILCEFNNDTHDICYGIIEEREKLTAAADANEALRREMDKLLFDINVPCDGDNCQRLTAAAEREKVVINERDACHIELKKISDALGTIEGHSSVDHIVELRKRVRVLRGIATDYIGMDVNCPCCGENEKCLDDCTWAEDNPNDVDRMESARKTIKALAECAEVGK